MKLQNLWNLLSFFFCLASFSQDVKAQQNHDIRYSFALDTILIKGSQTFSNSITVENLLNRKVELTPIQSQTMTLNGLITLPTKIILQPHEKRSYPLKYIADRHTIKSKVQRFTIALSASEKNLNIPPPLSFYTQLIEDKQLTISTEQSEYYFDPSGNPIQIMIHASNGSLVPTSFRLVLSEIPEGLEFRGEPMFISLQAGEQILVPFTANVKANNKRSDFNVTIQALDENGKMLTSKRVRLSGISSVKRFLSGSNFLHEPYQNSVALGYMSMNHGFSIYQMRGNGELVLGEKKNLKYRLHIDYLQNQRAVNIYDTYLDFEEKHWGLKIGNIYENLDHAVGGKGIKASYRFEGDRKISIYRVDDNYLLVGQLNNQIPGKKIIAAKFDFNSSLHQKGHLIYLQSKDGYRGVNSNQISAKTSLAVGRDHLLGIEGGYSLERSNHSHVKHAISAGVNYHYDINNYQFTTSNYYSSPYYSGLRRGLIQSNTRISRSFNNGNQITARISFLDNNPQYQEQEKRFFFNDNHNRIQIYELGYNTVFRKLLVSFRPYMMLQNLKNNRFLPQHNLNGNWSSNAIRVAADLSFLSHSHRFSINTDYGFTYKNTANRPLAPFHSVRINGNYKNKIFGFNTLIQINPYYLNDLLSLSEETNYQLYSFGPTIQFNAFKNTLTTQASTMYSYYGFSQTNNLSLNSSVRWKFGSNWSLTADVFYAMLQTRTPYNFQYHSPFTTHSFNNRQIRFGIEKNFYHADNSRGHTLRLLYFEDQNNNGIKDKTEPTVEGILVRINKEVAMSDKNGSVKFKNVPTGDYAVVIENSKGWSSSASVHVSVTKNQSFDIPLVKTKVLRGELVVIANRYQETEPELSGISIQAVDVNGKIYKTLSNMQGKYTFFLPPGSYTVFIDAEGLPFSIENATNTIELKDIDGTKTLDFRYKDERRKIGIKRF